MSRKQFVDDKLLVRQLRDGNREAFHQLYQRYHQDIYAFGFSLLKSKPQAEDLLQEVFLKVWMGRQRLNPTLSFRSFIFTITRNLAFNVLAKAANETKLQQSIFYKSQHKQKSADHVLLDANYQKLKDQALQELTPRCKLVFEMSRNEGKSYQEISEELGISVNTVKNQMSSALATLRSFLAKHGDIVFLLFMLIN